MSKREEMLAALEVAEALRPYALPNPILTTFYDAWIVARDKAQVAVRAWMEEQKKEDKS